MRSLVVLLALQTVLPGQSPERPPPFGVRVVEAATGRGVPLVELLTVHGVGFVTDSASDALSTTFSTKGGGGMQTRLHVENG